jgi:hypothetical protein
MDKRTIVLVLRSGKDFSFTDVELICKHINSKWKADEKPQIICLWDNATREYNLGKLKLIPLKNDYPGTWARMQLYSPEMEQYRPFLYVDLDTAIINSIENIFDLVKDESLFITLEDFWEKGKLATGLVWFPAASNKIQGVWKAWQKSSAKGVRMDKFLRECIKPDAFWQKLTDSIADFKPKSKEYLKLIKEGTNLVCFHGNPRIPQATNIKWVNEYVNL